MKLLVNGNDLSKYYNKVTWSGDDDSVSRKLDFGLIVSGTDKNLPKISVQLGDEISFQDDKGTVVFKGILVDKNKSITSNIMECTALDELYISKESEGTFDFENKTPADIAKKVFGSIGLTCGKLESGSPITRKFDIEKIYDMAYTAYYMEYEKTGKPYIIRMNNGKVEAIKKGEIFTQYVLDARSTLIDSKYGESSKDATAKVKVFDTEGKEKGEVSGEVAKGIVKIYREEKDEDGMKRAKGEVKGIERTANIRCFGDLTLITGNAVMVKETFTGLNGKFFIKADTHTFENNYHVCELELTYKNLMNDISTGDKDSKTTVGDGSMGAKAVSAGETIKGTHYKWGGTNPKSGVDCSGFVTWAYGQAGAKISGRITSAGMRGNPKAYGFQEVSMSDMKAGDVLWQPGHLAMYHGNGNIIESGGVSKRKLGYSGVAVTPIKGRSFKKAYRYVGG